MLGVSVFNLKVINIMKDLKEIKLDDKSFIDLVWLQSEMVRTGKGELEVLQDLVEGKCKNTELVSDNFKLVAKDVINTINSNKEEGNIIQIDISKLPDNILGGDAQIIHALEHNMYEVLKKQK